MKSSSESHHFLRRPSPETALGAALSLLFQPFEWILMLCRELDTSFVLGIMLVYGFSQGFAGSFFKVVSDFYWKDVQKVQPSAVQMYIGFYYIPWILKPVWGILTDIFPVRGYRRRPYFILAGVLGASTAFMISMDGKSTIPAALLCLVGMSAGMAIADVTIDACIAKNSIEKPNLAPDLQSLCSFVSSVGALIGYSSSGILVHLLGAQGALGLMAIPPLFLVVLGFAIFELKTTCPRENTERPAIAISKREVVFARLKEEEIVMEDISDSPRHSTILREGRRQATIADWLRMKMYFSFINYSINAFLTGPRLKDF